MSTDNQKPPVEFRLEYSLLVNQLSIDLKAMEKRHQRLFKTQPNFFTEEHSWIEIEKLMIDFRVKELELFLKWRKVEEEVEETVGSFLGRTN